jgi:hypothetical protein
MPECLVPESLTDLERERAKLLEQFRCASAENPPATVPSRTTLVTSRSSA